MSEYINADLSPGINRSLSHKVSKGVIWVTAAGICARGLNFISAIILARLLAPSDFGLMAIILFSNVITATGFKTIK